MRVLITGATGFIGKPLVGRLVQQGHEVVALVRSPEKAQTQIPFPCEFHRWDAAEPVPAKALAGIGAVYHLAGEGIADKRWTDERKRELRDSRVEGTRRLATALAAMPTHPKVISASAIGFYGDTGAREVDETTPVGTGFLAELCRDWEAAWGAMPADAVTIVRIGVVLGHGGGALEKLLPIFKLGMGGPLGSGDQFLSWIHRDDLVTLLVWALTAPVHGVLNGTSPKPVTNREFSEVLAAALKKPCFLKTPAFAVRLAMGESAQVVLSGSRVLPRRALGAGFEFALPTLEGALGDLLTGHQDKVLEREQFIPRPVKEIFPFFSDAKNLETLTPPWLGFEVVKSSSETVASGTIIDYRLKLRGIPLKWQSRIEEWVPNEHFVDVQLKGPYRVWHHTHEFESVPGGTIMRDRVRYRLPAGLLGQCVAGRFVENDVKAIFDYRFKKVAELFGHPTR